MVEVIGVVASGIALAQLRYRHEGAEIFRVEGMGGGTKDDRGLLSLVPRRRVADVSLASSTLSQRAVSTKHIESNKTSKQSSKETYGLPPRIPAKVENYLPKAYRSDYRGANESPNKRRKMAAGIFPDRPDKPNEMYASPSLSRSFQRLRHRQHRNTPERNATISRENSPQVISRQRTPSLTTQFQQQHFGRRQSGPASPVMSLPTSHSNKLPAVPALARPGEWQSFEDRLDNVEVPSERIKGICVSYTISEDMSGDGGNRILSRIGEKMRDSCEGKLRVRGSYIDRWSLKHEREAVGDDNGLQYHTQPQQQRPSHRPLPFGQSPSRTGSRLATGGLEDLKGSRARSSSNDYNRPKKGKPAEFERIVYCCQCNEPSNPNLVTRCFCDDGHQFCGECKIELIEVYIDGPRSTDEGLLKSVKASAVPETEAEIFLREHRPSQRQRHERTKEEVAELQAARRAEIERRCMLLSPPITAGVLAHMASFQASIQSIQPLDDSFWEVLKSRLLSQRGEAEKRENDRLAQTRVVQEHFDERRFQDMPNKKPGKHDKRNRTIIESDSSDSGTLVKRTTTTTYHPTADPQARSITLVTEKDFPELKREARNRERLLKEAQRIAGLTGISVGWKRSREEDDGVRRQKPRIEPRTDVRSLIPDVVLSPPSGVHPDRLKALSSQSSLVDRRRRERETGAPAGYVIAARGSQKSHAGTPRMPVATRPIFQIPTIRQASPLQGPMAQTPQMPIMGNQPIRMTSQPAHMLQQQRIQGAKRQRERAMGPRIGPGPVQHY